MSPFASFIALPSQNDRISSSKAGVLSSSSEAKVGRLNNLFFGVEHDGSSNCNQDGVQNSLARDTENVPTIEKVDENGLLLEHVCHSYRVLLQ